MKLAFSSSLPLFLLLTTAAPYYVVGKAADDCYKDWSSLSLDIYNAAFDSAFTGGIYKLCKNTLFDADTSSLKIYSSNIVVQCDEDGDPEDNCYINGGSYQIFVSEGLQGPPSGVELKGLTFSSPDMISVVAYGNNLELAVNNCVFKESIKSTTIGIYANGEGTKVIVSETSFKDNIYLTAIGSVAGAEIEVTNTTFSGNTLYGSEAVLGAVGASSSLSVTSSCFIDNTIVNATAAIYTETGTDTVIDIETNFGLNNVNIVSIDFCEGFLRNQDSSCQIFGASYCHANPEITPSASPSVKPSSEPSGKPFAAPSSSPTVTASFVPSSSPTGAPSKVASSVPSLAPTKPWCYDDWDILTTDLINATLDEKSNSIIPTYHLCPNTVLDASIRSLYLWESGVSVICGENGDLSDNCVIEGGDYQFFVADHPEKGSPKGVSIKGVTFTGQGVASVVVYGAGKSQVTVEDCLFENTDNEAAVSVYAGSSTTTRNEVAINSSRFRNNVLLSIIGNVGCDVSISKSLFNDNIALVSVYEVRAKPYRSVKMTIKLS